MKTCLKCSANLPRGRKNKWCSECNRAYQRAHYQANKATYRERARRVKAARKKEMGLLLRETAAQGCEDCGEKDFVVLDFDHRRRSTKIDTIANMVRNYRPLEVIRKEIKKCRVLCSNCHRRRTAKQLGWYKNF